MKFNNPVEVNVCEDVAVDENERSISQKTLHLFNASGGTENLFFMRKVKIEIGRFFICKTIGNAVGKVMSVDNSFTYIRRT